MLSLSVYLCLCPLRLRDLLLAEELEEANGQDQLQAQADPEERRGEARQRALGEIREHGAGADLVGREGAGQDGGAGAQDLGADERGRDVLAGERQEQHHAQAQALDRVEQAEPQPQAARDDGAGDGAADPGDVEADARGAPEHLRPAGGAEADGEQGHDPRVRLGEEGEDPQAEAPQDDEEAKGQEHRRPSRDVRRVEEELPVAPVQRREPEVLDDDVQQEPGHDVPAEERHVEARDLVGRLAVVVGQAEERDQPERPEDQGDRHRDHEHDGDLVGDEQAVQEPHRVLAGDDVAPVEETDDVDLLDALDDRRAEDPSRERCAACRKRVMLA